MSINKMSRTNQLYLSGGLVLAAMMGLAMLAAFVWAALWLWNKDFTRTLGDWYVKWALAGLVGAAIFEYQLSASVNLPAGFMAGALTAIGVGYGLYGVRRGHR